MDEPGALLLLEDDQALALDQDGEGLIVFDPETGKGAECCCGENGECCERVGEYGCATAAPPDPATVRNCGARVELRMHGTESLNAVGHQEFDSDGTPFTPSISAGGTYHAAVYWLLNSKLGAVCGAPTRCGTSLGLADGLNERRYTESGVALQNGVATSYSKSAKQTGNPDFLNAGPFRGYQRGFDAPCSADYYETLTPCYWTALDDGQSSIWRWLTLRFVDDDDPQQNSYSIMRAINESVRNEFGAPPYYNRWVRGHYQYNPDGDDIFVPADICGGSYDPFENYVGQGAGSFEFTWSATATPNGGSYTASLSGGGDDFNWSSYTATSSGSWSLEVTDCDGNIDKDDDRTPISCSAFFDAFAAGDPAADFNHDGYVNGDDYDLFIRLRPDCFKDIVIENRPDVNAARRTSRRVSGLVTPKDVLGLGGAAAPRGPARRPGGSRAEAAVRDQVRADLLIKLRGGRR